jgi:hypothetical protein
MTYLNTIYTIEEYIAQGFTAEEAPKAQRHDILFNKDQLGEATEEEREEMFAIIDELGL